MGTSAPAPPAEGDADDLENLDDLEMTSVMNPEQRRELQRAARTAKEQERETARPPPEATAAIEEEVSIPVSQATSPAMPSTSATWFVIAFILLAAAIAFELR
jgi:hypothetical protein